MQEYRRKYISNIFQAFNLINTYTVKQNIELALIVNGRDGRITKKKINGVTITRQEIIEFIINSDKDLETSYWLLQDLYKISIFSSFETFTNDIEEWFSNVRKSKIKEFIKLLASYKAWMSEIRNSFIIDEKTKKRLTNGFIEGKNNICKVVKRVGFGYKKFENLRNRILYIDNEKLNIKNK